MIKTVANKNIQAGNHQLVWNANDEKGNAVPAGIYLLRMETDNHSETKKIAIIK
ncbi:MAG: hypothetical protein HYX40_06005 [Sphingobacteriales bacterium]|nr:hypothetical protein [Sphingobacteriales bacterium]